MSLPTRKATVAAATAATVATLLALPTQLSSAAVESRSSTRAVGLESAESIEIPNPSFADGTARWRTTSRSDRLSPLGQGHGDADAVAVRPTSDARVVLQPVDPVLATVAADSVYYASAWVRSPSVGSSIQLRLGPAGADSAQRTLAGTTKRRKGVVVGDRMRWYRLAATYTSSKPTGPLTLKVVAQGLRQKAARLVVDDVTVQVRPPPAPPASTPPVPMFPGTTVPTPTPMPVPTNPRTPVPVVTPPPTPTPPATARWMSGASGWGAADGGFGAWRGATTPVAGTWNDNYQAQINQWSIQPGAEYGAWQGDLDLAVGGIYKDRGESWRAAAGGAYDARWRAMLSTITRAWGARPGTLYLRFAHEFNGNWYPWSVTAAEVADFRTAWRRFRALQQEVAPRTMLVFSPNSETSSSLGLDWREAFPGADQVDVMSVDYYNQYPFVATAADFDRTLLSVDSTGAPRGLERHRQFAAARGLPFAISEWSSDANMGDSPAFIAGLRRWLIEHGGTGAGQVLYEIHFNVDFGNGNYRFFPVTRQTDAAAAYRQLW